MSKKNMFYTLAALAVIVTGYLVYRNNRPRKIGHGDVSFREASEIIDDL